jgi:hypothetical protein
MSHRLVDFFLGTRARMHSILVIASNRMAARYILRSTWLPPACRAHCHGLQCAFHRCELERSLPRIADEPYVVRLL